MIINASIDYCRFEMPMVITSLFSAFFRFCRASAPATASWRISFRFWIYMARDAAALSIGYRCDDAIIFDKLPPAFSSVLAPSKWHHYNFHHQNKPNKLFWVLHAILILWFSFTARTLIYTAVSPIDNTQQTPHVYHILIDYFRIHFHFIRQVFRHVDDASHLACVISLFQISIIYYWYQNISMHHHNNALSRVRIV